MKNTAEQEKAFVQFLKSHKKLIIKVAGIYCQNSEERRDLTQEITLQLWKSWPSYNQKYALSTWSYRIALNVSISHLRKEASRKKKHEHYGQQWEILHWQDKELDAQLELLYKMMEHLKAMDKALLILSLEGKQNKEIAEIMGFTPSNVSTKLLRIKEQLKKQIHHFKN